MKNIAVFFGGVSVEHDISVITGVLTLNSLDKSIYNPVPIYIDRDGKWYTGESLFNVSNYKNLNYKKLSAVTLFAGDRTLYKLHGGRHKKIADLDAGVNCVHGVCGEDGALAGYAKMCSFAFCSPDIYPSSFSMDKHFTKQVLKGIKVKCLNDVCISRGRYYKDEDECIKQIEKTTPYPAIVKPASLGSSIGIKVCKDRQELRYALDTAFCYDEKVIVEKALLNCHEINCAAYKTEDKIIISDCEQPIPKEEILSFQDKYLNYKNGADKKFPADIPDEISEKINRTTKHIYESRGFRGVIRADYLVADGVVYLNELNTVPGSMAYYLFCKSMKEFSSMLTSIIIQGEKEFKDSQRTKRTYFSNILNIENVNGKK